MSVGKIFLICLAGIIVNLVGSVIAKVFDLPVYLDTIGTIFIAAMGGYVPGVMVGFFTNLIKACYQPSQMYFASVGVLIAILTTFFSRKVLFENVNRSFVLIPLLTFATGACDLVIESLLSATNFMNTSAFGLKFSANFLFEFLDKGLSVSIALAALNKVPPEVKRAFLLFGQKQAPLSEEMKRVIHDQKYLSSSLRTKMLLILTVSSLFLSISIALISYLLFKDSAIDEKTKIVDGMVTVALNEINPYRIDDFLKNGRNAEGYRKTEEKLYSIKNSSFYIKFLYVYKIKEDGCHVIFDLDTVTYKGDKPGAVVPLEKALEIYHNDFLAGKPIPPIITNDEYGYLLTVCKPLYDSMGRCVCYVAIDFSLDMLTEYLQAFITKLIALFMGCFVFIFVVGLSFIENNIILPVNTMAYCARSFSYDNAASRANNVELINNLKISTGDEIENLYSALIRTTENILRYLEHLQRAKVQVANMQGKVLALDELAHKDAMTGVKNKAAYDEAIALLDEEIAAGSAIFCIVMVDVNFLKRINDTYGHECGNIYLMNACRLVCSVFGEENVYRVGGDEFVVILEGDKASLIKYFTTQFKIEMGRKTSNESLKPWEKFSAAIGIATYQAGVDKSADEVFKRADAEMYENKLAMKAARTD